MDSLWLETPGGRCEIVLNGRTADLAPRLADRRAVFISEKTVIRELGSSFPEGDTIPLPAGENAKSLDTVRDVYGELLAREADRDTVLVGVGGGTVCDVTGFVAATYLRGLPFVFVPTTLLAQVDAALGGKNGVNLGAYKNLVGTFAQPELVLCDPEVLTTLPPVEQRNGLAETVKTAAIGDPILFAMLEDWAPNVPIVQQADLAEVVRRAVTVKLTVVSHDEREHGARRLLNFGHTLGHALERDAEMSHGEAVAVGMVAAARISAARGILPESELTRLGNLLARHGLPTEIPPDTPALVDRLRRDKKRHADGIRFVLLEALGRARVEWLRFDELEGLIRAVR